jgi:hypothetical protein
MTCVAKTVCAFAMASVSPSAPLNTYPHTYTLDTHTHGQDTLTPPYLLRHPETQTHRLRQGHTQNPGLRYTEPASVLPR